MSEEKSIVKLENIEFYYNKGLINELHALTDINIDIKQGEFASFFGSSGCGKSTMLYMISGIDKPDSGKVFFNGYDVSKFSPKEIAVYRQMGVGLIFQNFNLIPTLSVLDNVALPMTFLGLSTSKRHERATEILDYMGIKHLAKRLPYELSGGQQQRVGIARSLANDPPLILADEPTGNLDSANATKTMELLRDLSKNKGKTIILVTHEAWCLKYVDKIFYVKDGMITKSEAVAPQDTSSVSEGKIIEGRMQGAHINKNNFELASEYISTFFFRGYSNEEIKRAKEIILKRVSGIMSKEDFFIELDKPFKDGGLGLWKQKAKNIVSAVEEIINESLDISTIHNSLQKYPGMPLKDEFSDVRKYLLEIYKGRTSEYILDSFDECLYERVRNIITKDNFVKVLSLPKSVGGLGFSYSTALKISDRLEVLLSTNLAKVTS